MTPTQPSQAVEAAVQRIMNIAHRWAEEPDPLQCGRGNSLRDAIRAELARPQEVAPVTDKEVDDALAWCHLLAEVVTVEEMRRALTKFAASRAPVALPAERIKFLAENIAESIDGCDPSGAKATLQMLVDLVTPAPKQGDAAPSQYGSPELQSLVLAKLTEQGDAKDAILTRDEAELLDQTIEQLCDCGETDTPYEKLLDWTNRGYFECERFLSLPAAQAAIDSARLASQATAAGEGK